MANKKPQHDDESQRKEYLAILAIFERLLDSITQNMSQWEILEELMSLRADFAIHHAIRGFGMEYEEALELIRFADDELTDNEKAKRNIIVAAIDNLVDFAVAEEYQMADSLPDFDEILSEEEREELIAICKRYNYQYANIENLDIEYAMAIAAQLVSVSPLTTLTYMTQGDERVRPWHLQYEGFSAPKSSFPAWLIPPIEHRCRCYLVEDSSATSLGNIKNEIVHLPTMPSWFNPTFKESVALGGRIFSDEHPYFTIDEQHKEQLQDITDRIKQQYLNDKR